MTDLIDSLIDHAPALIVAVPLLLAFLTPLASKYLSGKIRTLLLLGGMAFVLILVLLLANEIYDEGPQSYVFGQRDDTSVDQDTGFVDYNDNEFPFRIIFTVDGLSIVMAMLITLTTIVALLFSETFFRRYNGKDKYYTVVMLLATGSFGMVLTGDLFNFFVFLEIASIAACALIAFRTDIAESVEAALKYMIVSTIGALMFLVAVGMLYGQYGSLNMGYLWANMELNTVDKIAMALIMASLAMKAGAVPMHMATPDAYGAAPAPVTVMVMAASEAVLYGIFRMGFGVFGQAIYDTGSDRLGWLIIILGLLSMFVGATMALVQKDLKRMMAYSAVSQTGYILTAVGVALAVYSTYGVDGGMYESFGRGALTGAIFHIFNHVLYMSLLFLTAGAVYHKTRTSDLNKLGGLGHDMKYTMGFFVVGAFSIAGLPPSAGFSSKFVIYESIYLYNPFLAIVALLVSVMTLAVFANIFYSVFLGPRQYDDLKDKGDVPMPMLAAMGILTALIIFSSLFPGVLIEWIIEPAVDAFAPIVQGGGGA